MQVGPPPEALAPLSWLVGRWKSTEALGEYPTIKPFTYCEEVEFKNTGQPLLYYDSKTWHPVKANPMHLETGFLRIKPGTNQVAFMVSHNFGLTTLEEGCVEDKVLTLKSTKISRMSFAKDPEVLKVERTFKILENGKLEMVLGMETSNTKMTQHLKAVYEKV